jgi:predicted DNA binding CopG/RHH family protein
MNKEEKELLKSFEKGEWKKAANYKSLLNDSKIAAKDFLKKDTRIIHKFVNNY